MELGSYCVRSMIVNSVIALLLQYPELILSHFVKSFFAKRAKAFRSDQTLLLLFFYYLKKKKIDLGK